MGSNEFALSVRIRASSLHVSTLSSLLRTLQAAVRDAAQGSEAGKRMLAAQPAPVLAVDTAAAAGGPVTLSFRFTDADGGTLHELNGAAFGAFMSGLEAALKVSPQRAMWGRPVRPLVRSAAESERLRLFLEDLVRLGDVTISAGRRQIVIAEGRVESGDK